MSRTVLLALALTLSSVPPVLAVPVLDNPVFTFPSVPYSFSTATNTFTGTESGGMLGAPVLDGDLAGTITVTFTDLGAFVDGTFQITGAIPSLGIPAASVVMQGQVTGVADILEIPDQHFDVLFALAIDTVHPLLGFTAEIGTWEAPVCNDQIECPTGPVNIADLFTTDYTDVSFPLNSFIRSGHEVAVVPYPAAALLLGSGLAVLAARRRLRRAERIGNMKALRRRAAVAPFLVSVNPTYGAGLGRRPPQEPKHSAH